MLPRFVASSPDRLLTRIFLSDPDGWILKGGAGLLARMPDVARHSLDIDVFRRTTIDAAVVDLAAAGDIDLGDFSRLTSRETAS